MKHITTILFALFLFMTPQLSQAQCKADFMYSISGSTVSFYDSSTANTSLIYSWQFGNNSMSSQQNPTHTYQNSGTTSYRVCLTIYDSARTCFDQICKTITIQGNQNNNCRAEFVYSVQGDTVYFTDSSTAASSRLNYSWDFGDRVNSSQKNPIYRYSSLGTYRVCLTIYDSSNQCTDTYCESVVIKSSGSNNCKAAFTYFTNGNTLVLTNTSSTAAVHKWTFAMAIPAGLRLRFIHTPLPVLTKFV